MLKWINTYFGNAYVRYFVFFFWCENLSCNNACTTDETTLFFVIYDLWFHKFVMLKPTLNNLTIPDSILILKFIVINYCIFLSIILSLIFFLFHKCQKHGKTIHEAPKFSRLRWALASSATWFFHQLFKII